MAGTRGRWRQIPAVPAVKNSPAFPQGRRGRAGSSNQDRKRWGKWRKKDSLLSTRNTQHKGQQMEGEEAYQPPPAENQPWDEKAAPKKEQMGGKKPGAQEGQRWEATRRAG